MIPDLFSTITFLFRGNNIKMQCNDKEKIKNMKDFLLNPKLTKTHYILSMEVILLMRN